MENNAVIGIKSSHRIIKESYFNPRPGNDLEIIEKIMLASVCSAQPTEYVG